MKFDEKMALSCLISAAGWTKIIQEGKLTTMGEPTADFLVSSLSQAAFHLASATGQNPKDAAELILKKYDGQEVPLPI